MAIAGSSVAGFRIKKETCHIPPYGGSRTFFKSVLQSLAIWARLRGLKMKEGEKNR
jgi:hypothetical protein